MWGVVGVAVDPGAEPGGGEGEVTGDTGAGGELHWSSV